MINSAIDMIIDRVDNPALNHPTLERKYKFKVQSSANIVKKMTKIGDLYQYLKRYETPDQTDQLYTTLKNLNLETYEDIFPEFCQQYRYHLEDVTTLSDFIIGETYTSWDIARFAKTYNNQSGIYLVGDTPNYHAIMIKATLSGGVYQNEWLIEDKELKYYFKKVSKDGVDVFKEEYKDNAAIISTGTLDIPIYLFIKTGTECKLNGVYKYDHHEIEENGAMWAHLKRYDQEETSYVSTEENYRQQLQNEVQTSSETSDADREARLANAAKKPEEIQIVSKAYKRNPDVIAAVLKRAGSDCENCGNEAPFNRRSNGTPYLEVHHVIPLSEDGDDTVDNAIAVCPNCHRELHFG